MKLTYETHFRSSRPDGRFVSSMASYMESLRHKKAILRLPENLTAESFGAWQAQVKAKVSELLNMPEMTGQPEPVLLSRAPRDGYTVEKWEFYPDDYSAVPFLALIPDGASAENPVPGVLCLPGSYCSKEFLAGEPLLDRTTCQFQKYPDRNMMALYMVKNGMAAFAFDNPATAECAVDGDKPGDFGQSTRQQLCYGYIQYGDCYPGISVFQKLCFLKQLPCFPFVDRTRLAVAAHSLGTMPAAFLGILCDEIKAVVFNDFVSDPRERFVSVTEEDELRMSQNSGNWHEIPGLWRWFSHHDLLAALAPKFLAMNEGGAEAYLQTVRRAYSLLGVSDRCQVGYYPMYGKPEARLYDDSPMPLYGLSDQEYFARCNVDAPDHSFREEPSVRLLKQCFFDKRIR